MVTAAPRWCNGTTDPIRVDGTRGRFRLGAFGEFLESVWFSTVESGGNVRYENSFYRSFDESRLRAGVLIIVMIQPAP